jgi:hypothetical protein
VAYRCLILCKNVKLKLCGLIFWAVRLKLWTVHDTVALKFVSCFESLQLPCFAYATQHIYNLTKKKNRKKKKAICIGGVAKKPKGNGISPEG